jgi:hypothetical protein
VAFLHPAKSSGFLFWARRKKEGAERKVRRQIQIDSDALVERGKR